ncbi:MAG TPA: rhomboid family intramembrane serine protease [Candidatus Thermoplasmatota archaeon]|nr:rhomboid family intramembrane serine protease [Candidatus Thermoplasmatota archaeon]
MAVGRCEQCGTEEYMPFVCKFCKGRFCSNHRLPENHSCRGLEGYKERVRTEGRLYHPEATDVLTPRVKAGAAWRARLDTLFGKVEGKVAYVLLGVMAALYVVEFILFNTLPYETWDRIFVLRADFWRAPWTLVTSIFAHDVLHFSHFFVNAIALFFFGPAVERLIGSRRFTGIFFASGIIAGLLQVYVFDLLFNAQSGAIGASGALMGIMGTLVVLAPKMQVLLMFIIPVPLWGIVAMYAMLDVLGVMNPAGRVGNIAHLAGLGLGLLYGMQLRKQGLRAHVQEPQRNVRRYF